jgi:ornithine carbamoyltransferase
MSKHLLSLMDLSSGDLRRIIDRAIELKAMRREGKACASLEGKILGLIFEKFSTRTRVSFECGIYQLGGTAIFLSPRDTQLGRGEPIEDTARVLSRMVDIIAVRTFGQDTLERFAAHSSVPVINALTDLYHPCQVLADIQTFVEHRGDIGGATIAWIGDGNNMCNSFINAARLLDFDLRAACPPGYLPDPELVHQAGNRVSVSSDPGAAVSGADLIVTDVWASMGQESEQAVRLAAFEGYQVNEGLIAKAKSGVLVMHCLPAHRGEEISAEVLDGPHSVVWDEAENRLHAQKALMEYLLSG